ncbi:MAG: hypothetical protein KatS3mg105_0304 [Gemmatales bacterium]|nr:MAG: hypothetical protein KatS3mg105_0304 [Gemmatales bacterium]
MNGWRKWIKLLGLAGLFASLSYSPARCQHEYDPTVRIRPNQCETYVTLPRYGNAERVAPMHGLILRDLPERTREGIRGRSRQPNIDGCRPNGNLLR